MSTPDPLLTAPAEKMDWSKAAILQSHGRFEFHDGRPAIEGRVVQYGPADTVGVASLEACKASAGTPEPDLGRFTAREIKTFELLSASR